MKATIDSIKNGEIFVNLLIPGFGTVYGVRLSRAYSPDGWSFDDRAPVLIDGPEEEKVICAAVAEALREVAAGMVSRRYRVEVEGAKS